MNASLLEGEVCARTDAPLPTVCSHGEGVWLAAADDRPAVADER